jgi:hypothetical protein
MKTLDKLAIGLGILTAISFIPANKNPPEYFTSSTILSGLETARVYSGGKKDSGLINYDNDGTPDIYLIGKNNFGYVMPSKQRNTLKQTWIKITEDYLEKLKRANP